MQYLNGISVFDICQAHEQLEADYNVGGWVKERLSNQRRKESTGCQLSRMQYNSNGRWVDIENRVNKEDSANNDVRFVYCMKVLQWGLYDPTDKGMQKAIKDAIYIEYLRNNYPQVLK